MSGMAEKKKRIEEIDIIKAIAIILMVAGHSGAPFTSFIYLFHMAAFFIASGFFFKDGSSENIHLVWKGIVNKLRHLWIPFFVWNAIFTLLHNTFINLNVYTDNPKFLEYVSGTYVQTTARYSHIDVVKQVIKGALFSTQEQLFGAGWFLKTLFIVSVSYLAFNYISKKLFGEKTIVIQLIISIVLLIAGFFCSLHDISAAGIAKASSYYILYFVGHVFGVYKEKYNNLKLKHYLVVFVISFIILIMLNRIGTIAWSRNKYINPIFLLLSSISGWILLYSVASFVKRISIIKQAMLFLGNKTMSIVLLHFLCFKTVGVIVANYYGLPMFCVAAFPNLFGERGLWWLAYSAVGTILPVVMNVLFRRFENQIVKMKK